jgi:hypothetical protein
MAYLVIKRDSEGTPTSKIPIWYFYLVAFIASCVACVVSLKQSDTLVSNYIDIVILLSLWGASACIAYLLVYLNYKTARKILIPTSRSYREYKLSRLVMTVPLYTIILHVLVLGITSKFINTNTDSLVFDRGTLVKPSYLVLCGSALFFAWIFGSIPLSLKTEWNESFFVTFSSISFSGAIFGASIYIIYSTIRTNNSL